VGKEYERIEKRKISGRSPKINREGRRGGDYGGSIVFFGGEGTLIRKDWQINSKEGFWVSREEEHEWWLNAYLASGIKDEKRLKRRGVKDGGGLFR